MEGLWRGEDGLGLFFHTETKGRRGNVKGGIDDERFGEHTETGSADAC
jgi:hypothetical protein